jgi:hypothetical protein
MRFLFPHLVIKHAPARLRLRAGREALGDANCHLRSPQRGDVREMVPQPSWVNATPWRKSAQATPGGICQRPRASACPSYTVTCGPTGCPQSPSSTSTPCYAALPVRVCPTQAPTSSGVLNSGASRTLHLPNPASTRDQRTPARRSGTGDPAWPEGAVHHGLCRECHAGERLPRSRHGDDHEAIRG